MGVKSATKKYSVGKEGKGVSNDAFSSTGAGVTQFLLSSQFRDRKGLVFLKILSDTTNLKKKKGKEMGVGEIYRYNCNLPLSSLKWVGEENTNTQWAE